MEASKSSQGKYLDDPDGGVEKWEGDRDDGDLVGADASQGRCEESALVEQSVMQH